MPDAGPFEPERAHRYTAQERAQQLARFASTCRALARLSSDHDPDVARAYESIAAAAAEMQRGEQDQAALNELASALPERPPWLHPKFADYQMPRARWQDDVATKREEAENIALELRSLATY